MTNSAKAISLLKEQLSKIEGLKKPPGFNPQYQIWNSTTTKILQESFGEDYLRLYHGAGSGHIAMNEQHLYNNYIETLEEKRQLIEGFIQEHERFTGTAEATFIGQKLNLSYAIHPEIEKVSGKLLEDGHYAQAVEEAFKRVIKEVKTMMVQRDEGIYDGGDSLMNHAFSVETPIVKFNELSTREETDEQKGIMFLFKGVVAIRNRKAHDNVILNDPERAFEYCSLASLLMRLLGQVVS